MRALSRGHLRTMLGKLQEVMLDARESFERYVDVHQSYNQALGARALITPNHPVILKLLRKTREHPKFHRRYVSDLEQFSPITRLEKATDVDKLLAGDKVVGGIEPVLALDCEMVQTAADNMALARLSAVNVVGETVIDVLVLPCHHSYIEDCRTHITGIELHDLKNKGVSMETARRLFATKADASTILLGHALEHDIMALQISHDRVIDTALLYPVIDETGSVNEELSHGLDYLTEIILKRSMDRDKRHGVHDSVEDAKNSLDLVKHLISLERKELELKPIPKRVRARRRGRGVNYGVAASLRSIQTYSLAQAVDGASGASALSAELERTRYGTRRKRKDKPTPEVPRVTSGMSPATAYARVDAAGKKRAISSKASLQGSIISARVAQTARRLEKKTAAKRKLSSLKASSRSFSKQRWSKR